VLEHIRHKYACAHCNSGRCQKCDGNAHVDLADKPQQPIEKGLAGPGLLAYVVTSKLADHLPLYRLEQIFARQQVRIHRSTLLNVDWIKEVAPLPGGGLNVRLKDAKATDLTVARDRAREFKVRLGC